MKYSLASCCFAVFATAMALPAHAVLITQTSTFGTSPLQAAMPNPTFNQFDASLGTLSQVTITLGATITGSTTVRRTCDFFLGCTTNQTPGGGTTRTLSLDLPTGTTDLLLTHTDPWNTAFNTDLANGATQTQTESVNQALSTQVLDNTALAAYIGLSTITFDLSGAVTQNLSFFQTGNNWDILALTGFGSGTVTVVYDYTAAAAPEPTTLGLLGIGLLGLGAFARRRRWTVGSSRPANAGH